MERFGSPQQTAGGSESNFRSLEVRLVSELEGCEGSLPGASNIPGPSGTVLARVSLDYHARLRFSNPYTVLIYVMAAQVCTLSCT